MRNIVSMLISLSLVYACTNPAGRTSGGGEDIAAAGAPKSEQRVSPGEGIGLLTIGMPVDSAISKMGRPDSVNAAMGSSLMVWHQGNKKYRIAIFAGRNMGVDDVNRIKRIMVSSPSFSTADGVSCGTELAELEVKYSLKKMNDRAARDKGLLVFSNSARGIVFDVDSLSKKCVAITVHAADKGDDTYINMH